VSLKDFKKINVKDYETSMIQDNVSEYLKQITNNPRINGLLIENIDLVFGQTTTVNHGLGRAIRGFEIVYKNNSVDIWAEDSNQSLPTKTITLSTSADATINLWVY